MKNLTKLYHQNFKIHHLNTQGIQKKIQIFMEYGSKLIY